MALLIGIGALVLVIVAAVAFAVVSISRAEEGDASDTTGSSVAGSSDQLSVGTSGTDSVTGAPAQVSGEPFRTCEICHPDYLDKPDPTGDLVFSHKTHIDNGVQCSTCHVSPVGHFDTPAPMMMTCLSCHEGETAPNDCKN
ncbi:MAG: cytochrome c3 family protein, partial [Thermoleophilia bacterium]|nr:cytochrome c3 family protein [Thermoleophilia bacterium]